MPTRSLTNSLTRSVTRGLTDPALGGFSPGASFFAGSQGFAYDLSDKSKLYVDSARTVQVATAGDLIGSVTDISGNGNHASQVTTGSKPAWQTTYAALDGFDDFLATAAINLTATNKVTVVAGVRKLSDAAIGFLVESSADSSANNGAFAIRAPSTTGTANYGIGLRGSVAGEVYATGANHAAPVTNVLAASYDTAGVAVSDRLKLRVNGAAVSLPVAQIAGPTGAGALGSHPIYIGRRAGDMFPFNGRIYRIIVIGRLLNATELARAERWCALNTGVSL